MASDAASLQYLPVPSLLHRLAPCGPIVDPKAADRLLAVLTEAAAEDGWQETLADAWRALAPVFAASPYLASLARRDPDIV